MKLKPRNDIKKLREINKRLLVIIFLFIFALTAQVMVFVILRVNNRTIQQNITQEQRTLGYHIAEGVKALLQKGASEEEIVRFLSACVNSSSKKYLYFAEGDEIVYIRDAALTNQYKGKDINQYLNSLSEEDYLITKSAFSFDGIICSVGIITDKNEIESRWETTKLPLFVISLMIFVTFIYIGISGYFFVRYEKEYAKKKKLGKELNKSNTLVEDLNKQISENSIELDEAKREIAKMSNRFYDINVLTRILEKSDEADLRPVGIIIVKLFMGDKYCTRNEMLEFSGAIEKHLESGQILSEVTKGEFSVLTYGLDKDKLQEKLHAIYQDVMPIGERQSIPVRYAAGVADDISVSARELFIKVRSQCTE